MTADEAITTTLHPGDVALGQHGDTLETLLGSCVAIVITDPRRTVGAMCHIVHSRRAPSHALATGAYADVALATMVSLLQQRGITARLCEAYVYGGGNMFPQLEQAPSVGDGNADWALAALAALGIRVLAVDVGGAAYRRLSWTVGRGAPQVITTAV
jgi:chemotaxis protein CheD